MSGEWSGALFRLCGAQSSTWYSKPIRREWSIYLPAMIHLLVENGANINQTDRCGNTPLMWAVCCPDGNDGGGYAQAAR